MNNKLFVFWNSYKSNTLLAIGILKKEKKEYTFSFYTEALKAVKEGCLLPFNYVQEDINFQSMPLFFQNRIINEEMKKVLNVDPEMDDFGLLSLNHGLKNSDNFYLMSEEEYTKLTAKQDNKTHRI